MYQLINEYTHERFNTMKVSQWVANCANTYLKSIGSPYRWVDVGELNGIDIATQNELDSWAEGL